MLLLMSFLLDICAFEKVPVIFFFHEGAKANVYMSLELQVDPVSPSLGRTNLSRDWKQKEKAV